METVFMKIIHLAKKILILLALAVLFCPAQGAINTISQGNTVFIGEEGLDISGATAPGSVDLGWWASGAAIATSSPDYQVTVTDTTNLYISPTEFGSRTGTWYWLPAKTALFTVADPNLAIRVEDTTVNVDVTNAWVPTDDQIRFRIETNLLPIASRTGVASVPVTIKVQDPSGATYSALTDNTGTSTSLVDFPVTTSPFFTGSIWDTGRRDQYSPGTYTIWVECNVNSMKDNYDQAGKTVSQKVTVQNQDHNPRITGNYPATPVKTTVKTTIPTTVKTTILVTPTPTVPATPGTTLTTPVPVMTSEPVPPDTTTAVPTTTYAPGFEGFLAVVSLGIALLVWLRKD